MDDGGRDDAKFKSDHDGHAFYFCSTECKPTFDKDPHKYGRPHG